MAVVVRAGRRADMRFSFVGVAAWPSTLGVPGDAGKASAVGEERRSAPAPHRGTVDGARGADVGQPQPDSSTPPGTSASGS